MVLKNSFIVVGSHWNALLSVGVLLSAGKKVLWIHNTGSHLDYPTTLLPSEKELNVLAHLGNLFSLPLEKGETGQFVREFRNKSFQPPAWEEEVELWEPEKRLISLEQLSTQQNLFQWFRELREQINEHPLLESIRGIGITQVSYNEDRGWILELESGDQKSADELIWADRMDSLRAVEGIKKQVSLKTFNTLKNEEKEQTIRFSDFGSRLHTVGALQVSFKHHWAIKEDLSETLLLTPGKDSKDSVDRKVIGFLSQDGLQSEWSILLNHSELENNHEIAKRLRKLKMTLNRAFQTLEWLPEGVKDFQANVQSEAVRFEENVLWATHWVSGHPYQIHLKSKDLSFTGLSDALGLECGLSQWVEHFESHSEDYGFNWSSLQAIEANGQDVDQDSSDAQLSE